MYLKLNRESGMKSKLRWKVYFELFFTLLQQLLWWRGLPTAVTLHFAPSGAPQLYTASQSSPYHWISPASLGSRDTHCSPVRESPYNLSCDDHLPCWPLARKYVAQLALCSILIPYYILHNFLLCMSNLLSFFSHAPCLNIEYQLNIMSILQEGTTDSQPTAAPSSSSPPKIDLQSCTPDELAAWLLTHRFQVRRT